MSHSRRKNQDLSSLYFSSLYILQHMIRGIGLNLYLYSITYSQDFSIHILLTMLVMRIFLHSFRRIFCNLFLELFRFFCLKKFPIKFLKSHEYYPQDIILQNHKALYMRHTPSIHHFLNTNPSFQLEHKYLSNWYYKRLPNMN